MTEHRAVRCGRCNAKIDEANDPRKSSAVVWLYAFSVRPYQVETFPAREPNRPRFILDLPDLAHRGFFVTFFVT